MITKALWVRLVAKPGKEQDVAAFLRQGQQLAQAEPATATWYAVQLDTHTFAIFDTFPDDAGRDTHLAGPIAKALMAQASELLSQAPEILKLDVLASKS